MTGRRNTQPQKGFTLLELVVAGFLSMIVVFGLGNLILANQRAWEWGREKVEMQQNTARAMDKMTASVRSAFSITVPSTTWFYTRDENGVQMHEYRLAGSGDAARLTEDGVPLTEYTCTGFSISSVSYNTCLTFTVEFEDETGDRIETVAAASIRNRGFSF